MTDRNTVLLAYEQAWIQTEKDDVREALTKCWTPSSVYINPLTDVVRGIDAMVELILDFPVMFPDAQLRLTSTPDTHHDAAYFTWQLTSTMRIRTMGRDYGRCLNGLDFVEFDDDGMIRRITAFFGVDRAAAIDLREQGAQHASGRPVASSGVAATGGYNGRSLDLDARRPVGQPG